MASVSKDEAKKYHMEYHPGLMVRDAPAALLTMRETRTNEFSTVAGRVRGARKKDLKA